MNVTVPFPSGLALLAPGLAAAWAYVAVSAWPPGLARRGARVALYALACAWPLATRGPGAVQLVAGLLAGYLAIRAAALGAVGARPERPIWAGLLSVDDLLRPAPPDPRRRRPRALLVGVGGALACVALLVAGDALRLWRWSRYADDLLACLEVAVGAMGLNNLILAASPRPIAGLQDRPALSASLAELWAARWNHLVAPNLDRGFFRPLARRRHPAAGVLAAFAASGIMHVVPVLAAAPLPAAALPACQVFAFFLLHGALVLGERALGLHRAPRSLLVARVRTVTLFVLLTPMMLGPFADVCHVHGRSLAGVARSELQRDAAHPVDEAVVHREVAVDGVREHRP
jgi:hypothetical protein